MANPQLSTWIERLRKGVQRQPHGSSRALDAILDEALLTQRQYHEGVHLHSPHPVVQKLQNHRQAVALRYLDCLDQFCNHQDQVQAQHVAFRQAQRYRYETYKRWQTAPLDQPERVEAAQAQDEAAQVALAQAEHEAAQAHKNAQAQRWLLEHWDDQLLYAQRSVLQARAQTTVTLGTSLGAGPRPAALVQVPLQAPALRVRPR